jgi:Ribbon-helix-helix protein, copG family
MVRTTVYLDEQDKRRLAAMAAATGISEAELVRRGVRMVIASGERRRPRAAYARSHDGSAARHSDELLAVLGH